MRNYKNMLKDIFQTVLPVLCLIAVLISYVFIIQESQEPLDSAELMAHFEKLEIIQEDFSKVIGLEGADVNIGDGGTVVRFVSDNVELKAYFDEYDAYIRSDIIDKRAVKDFNVLLFAFIVCIAAIIFTAYAIRTILLIPVYIADIVNKIKEKKKARKNKEEIKPNSEEEM